MELIETDALLTELLRRFEHGIVVLMRPGVRTEWGEAHYVLRRWVGNSHTVVGLCLDGMTSVQQDYASRVVQEGTGEP